MNNIIWFLTDTDFQSEWANSSLLDKIFLIYTTTGLIFFELLSFLSIMDIIF